MLWLYKAHRRQVGASAGQTTMPKNAAAAVAAPAQTLLLSAGNEPRESEILANDAGGLFFCFIPHLSTAFQQWTSSQHIYWCQSHERHFFGSSHTQTECQLIHIYLYIPHSVVFANLKLNTRKRGLRVSSLVLNPLCLVEICPSNRSLIPSSRSIRRLLNSRKNCLREKN